MIRSLALPVALLALTGCASLDSQAAAASGASARGRAVGTLPRSVAEVVYVPTVMPVVATMLELARVDSSDLVYDLGSGDGRIVITAASRRGARGVGVEIDRRLVAQSRVNADSARVSDRVEFRSDDLFTTDLRPATAVMLYLLPTLNVRLRPKLFDELVPGTPVVSHEFPMGDWEPDSTVDVEGRKVHLWHVPVQLAGRWRVEHEGRDAGELRLFQRYQRGEGVLLRDARLVDVDSLQVRGTIVRMLVRAPTGTVRLRGDLAGGRDRRVARVASRPDSMTLQEEGSGRRWRLVRSAP